MSIGAIPPVSPSALGALSPTGAAGGATNAAQAGSGSSFAAGLQQVADLQATADQAATKVATGDAADIHQFMAAASKASLAMELTVAVRDKAVEAYQEVMRMQV